ncbi:MAG TPA: RING finger protein, partial [Chloroflexota bacterium]|nr:RING finger protein [Chloroflexota bacterium]
MLSPITVDKQSPFLGEECALCKDPLTPGELVVICPEDGSRHHDRCWLANGNKCAAYGCRGHGEITPSPNPTPNPSLPHPDTLSPPHP